MKQTIFTAILILAFSFPAFAQTNENQPMLESDPVDRFGKIAFFDYTARLQNLFRSVQEYPKSKGLIVLELNKKDKQSSKFEQLKSIYKAVNFLKFDKTRLLVIVFEGNYQETTLWVVPPGTELPKIKTENFKLIKGEKLQQKIKQIFPKNKNL